MVKKVLLLSGPVSSGKSTLCRNLATRFKITHFKTRDLLLALHPEVVRERGAMQALGETLDRKTKGAWVGRGLEKALRERNLDEDAIVAVDAVRIREQIAAIRKAYGSSKVVHIHLTAPDQELAKRYKARPHENVQELTSYAQVQTNKTEAQVPQLADVADILIDTHRCTEMDVLAKAASRLGLYGRDSCRLVDVLVGGQYGSEGKGHLASYLAPEYDLLVRVGGPNAGHKVFSDPPYTFHHLPSGSLRAPRAQLLIGPGATLYPPTLLKEIADCNIPCDRLVIDEQAMIITDADREAEQALRKSMGSTAQGVGEAAARRIRDRHPGAVKLARDEKLLKPYLGHACAVLEDAYRAGLRIFLEGTQGTALSLYHGSYPYVTSRDTAVAGCLAEAGISPARTRKIIMVCRTYPIRVQSPQDKTSGPFSREIKWSVVEKRSGYAAGALSKKERTSTTNRKRRVGEFEWDSLRKAASLNAPTDIALTFADYITKRNADARRFEQLSPETIRFVEEIERVVAAPVSLISTRFDYRSIIDRRAW